MLSSGDETDGVTELEEEKGKRRGWGGFGPSGLSQIVDDWDGVGIVEICGQRRVGKSVSPSWGQIARSMSLGES